MGQGDGDAATTCRGPLAHVQRFGGVDGQRASRRRAGGLQLEVPGGHEAVRPIGALHLDPLPMLTDPGAGGIGVAQHGDRFARAQPRQLLRTGRRAGAQPHLVGSVDDEAAGGGNLDFLKIGQRVYHPVRVARRFGADQLEGEMQVRAKGVAREPGQPDQFAGFHALVPGDQRPGQVGVDGVIFAAIDPVPDAHVEAVGITVVGPDVEHLAVRAGIDVGPDRRSKVEPLVTGLVILGIDVWVLAKVLRDDVIVYGPPQPEFAGHNSLPENTDRQDWRIMRV